MRHHGMLTTALAVALASTAAAQSSNVVPDARSAWGENVGWTNWQQAGGGASGVRLLATPGGAGLLAGWCWAENVGWIDLGDGTPADGVAYANDDASDHGVNVDFATGRLDGFAWSENAGWISFDTADTGDAARLDPVSHRFDGFAWAENLGWIDLGVDLEIVDPADDLGAALAGTDGAEPQLLYFGLMDSGEEHVVVVRESIPSTPLALFLSDKANPTPFKGGKLIPVPPLLVLEFTTDATGTFAIPAASGTGLGVPIGIYVQAALLDPGAVAGIALTNAVKVEYGP